VVVVVVVWQVAVGIGDLGWAAQCWQLASGLDPHHGEALNNLGVLELRRGREQKVGARQGCVRSVQDKGGSGACWACWS
jgi:hypothetical protein